MGLFDWLLGKRRAPAPSPTTRKPDAVPKSPPPAFEPDLVLPAPSVQALAVSPDGRRLAAGCTGDDHVILWDVASGQKCGRARFPSQVWDVAFAPDGALMATAHGAHGTRGELRLLDPTGLEEVALLAGHDAIARAVCFSPDGRLLGSAGEDGTARLWDVATRREVRRLAIPFKEVSSLAFSPDGTLVAVSGGTSYRYGQVLIWEVATGQVRTTVEGERQDGPVRLGGPGDTCVLHELAFDPSSTRLAVGTGRHCALLFDLDTGRQVAMLRGNSRYVHMVAFSTDGKQLATGDLEGQVIVWNAQTREPVVSFHAVKGGMFALMKDLLFLPDALHVVTAGGSSNNTSVKFWPLVPTARRNDRTDVRDA